MKLNIGDVVLLDTSDKKFAIIRDVKPNRPKHKLVIQMNGQDDRRHKCPMSLVLKVIGKVDIDELDKETEKIPPPKVNFGTSKAGGNVQEGDKIKVRHGSKTVTAEFVRYNNRAYRYPVVYRYNGKKYKAASSDVVG